MQTSSNVRRAASTGFARRPPALDAGSRIALVCASGPLRDATDVERAEGHVRRMGCVPVRAPHVLARAGYLAGTDDERLADLQWALDDPGIDAVWCIRGGFGMTRLLPRLSLTQFSVRPKAVLGYSDVTALHCAIAARTGVMSFHTHTARAELPPMSVASLQAAITGRGEPCGVWPDARAVHPGRATGRMAGGNLALLASLCGTPDALDGRGAIVVLEDINEAAYRVDRMLRQLEQAGAFDGCAGLAVGQFTLVPVDENPDASSIDELIAELAGRLGVPCLANLPIGHIADQWTLPLGGPATIDADARALLVGEQVGKAVAVPGGASCL